MPGTPSFLVEWMAVLVTSLTHLYLAGFWRISSNIYSYKSYYDFVYEDMIWYGMKIWYDMVWYGMKIGYDMIWYGWMNRPFTLKHTPMTCVSSPLSHAVTVPVRVWQCFWYVFFFCWFCLRVAAAIFQLLYFQVWKSIIQYNLTSQKGEDGVVMSFIFMVGWFLTQKTSFKLSSWSQCIMRSRSITDIIPWHPLTCQELDIVRKSN